MNLRVRFETRIPNYVGVLNNTIAPAVSQAAGVMVELARSQVRVDTTSLQETIDTSEIVATGAHAIFSVNAGDITGGYKGGGLFNKPEGSPVNYAAAQEWGPGEHTPYMTPASEAGWPEFQNILAARLRAITV